MQTPVQAKTTIGEFLGAVVALLLISGCAPAPADFASLSQPVELTDAQQRYPLSGSLAILEDPTGELSIEDVTSQERLAEFVPNSGTIPNFGNTESAYWVRVPLVNETRATTSWLLEAGQPNMHFVELYTPLLDGSGFTVRRTGALVPLNERDIRNPRMVLHAEIPPNAAQDLYVRFETGTAMHLPMTLWSPDAFWAHSERDQLLHGVFFGALLALLAYNVFLLIALRERSYLYLVVLLASMIAFEAGYSGYIETYVAPRAYHLKPYYQAISFSLIFVSMLLFADAFLELKNRLPKLHWMTFAALAIWGALLLTTPFVSYGTLTKLMLPWTLPSLLIVLTAGAVSWQRGYEYARFFMIAWSGLLLAFIVTILTRLGLIPSTQVTESIYRFGLVWMAVCWSIALADRINVLRSRVQSSERKLSQILEGLPLGVVVYGSDNRANYLNQRVLDILTNTARGIQPDLSARRTFNEAAEYFSFRLAGSDMPYPMDMMPVTQAFRGEMASADDLEVDLVDRRVPLEVWASPVKDLDGEVESVIVAFQDITLRRRTEAELDEYRTHLEELVVQRTAQLNDEATAREALAQAQSKLIAWLTVINERQQALGDPDELPSTYQHLLTSIRAMMDADAALINIWSTRTDQPDILYCVTPETTFGPDDNPLPFIPKDALLVRALEQGKVLLLPVDASSTIAASFEPCLSPTMQAIALAPIRSEKSVIGVLGLSSNRPPDAFLEEDIILLSRMAFDIGNLAQYARLAESSRALVASEERNRLARDLHDSVTQVLFSASLIGDVLPRIWKRDPERGLESLEELRSLTRGALAEMRTMLLELRPASVLKTPLPELLAQLTEAATSRTELGFDLFMEQIRPLPDEVHVAFYRIAQEALNNVVKHAQATSIEVSLSTEPRVPVSDSDNQITTILVIADDGVGFASYDRAPERIGFGTMSERASAIGADLTIQSAPGEGTQVTLSWTQ